jgi:hypothetical protein
MKKTITVLALQKALMEAKDEIMNSASFIPEDKLAIYYPDITIALSKMYKKLVE